MIGRILFVIAVICIALSLSVVDRPELDQKAFADKVRKIIVDEGPNLPEDGAARRVERRISHLDGVRDVRRLDEGESLDSLCAEGLEEGTVYIAIPPVTSQDGGIYGAMYALDDTQVLSIIVLSPLAQATDPRASQLLDEVDGTTMSC
jgi:hypothetical protein